MAAEGASVLPIEIVGDERSVIQIRKHYSNFTSIQKLPRLDVFLYILHFYRMKCTPSSVFRIVALNSQFWPFTHPAELFKGLTAILFHHCNDPSSFNVLLFHTRPGTSESFYQRLESFGGQLAVLHIPDITSTLNNFLQHQLINPPIRIDVLGNGNFLLCLREHLFRFKFCNHSAQNSIYAMMGIIKPLYPDGNPCKIVQFLTFQGMSIYLFIRYLIDLLDRKKRLLLFCGPPSTGKTAFIYPILRLFHTGEYSEIHGLENCHKKDIIFWDTIQLNLTTAPIFKQLATGTPSSSSNECRKPFIGISTPLPPFNHDSDVTRQMNIVKFSKPAHKYSDFSYCDHPSITCGRHNSDNIHEYWQDYLKQHQICHPSCNHCAPNFCHYEMFSSMLYCYDHKRTHYFDKSKELCFYRDLHSFNRANLPQEYPVLTPTHLITPNDWLAFFSTYVRNFKETHISID